MMKKVAIITGSNKGIGFGIVRGLAKKLDKEIYDVYVTSRDSSRGMEALKALMDEGFVVHYHQCDISDSSSIEKLRDFCKDKYGGIDILVNNAGIAFKNAASDPMIVQAELTLKTNYWDTKKACQILFDVLKPGARVVNVSSSAGFLGNINGKEDKAKQLRDKLCSENLSYDELDQLATQYVENVKNGDHYEQGWPKSSNYVVSKVLLSALTRIQQRDFDKDPDSDYVINHVHPGYVDTDMTSHKGPLTIDQGAKSSIYAATLPPMTELKGKYFWTDCQEVDWVNGPKPTPY